MEEDNSQSIKQIGNYENDTAICASKLPSSTKRCAFLKARSASSCIVVLSSVWIRFLSNRAP
jgi:hypothetical protein